MKTRFHPLWAAGAAAATLVLALPMLFASPACGEDSYGDAVEETAPLTFETAFDALRPHGRWHGVEPYGQIWVPAGMPAGWRPYVHDGHWVYTDAGWYWYSAYEWGWLTFHYGRWYNDPEYGWAWVPGYIWAPAWVTWYWNDRYVGWAPVPPAGYDETYAVDPGSWFFVGCEYFVSPDVGGYYVPPVVVAPVVCVPYYVVNKYYFFFGNYYCGGDGVTIVWYGPTLTVIERGIGRSLRRYVIRETNVRERNNRVREGGVVEVYRPPTDQMRRVAQRFDEHRVRREDAGNAGTRDDRREPVRRPAPDEQRMLPVQAAPRTPGREKIVAATGPSIEPARLIGRTPVESAPRRVEDGNTPAPDRTPVAAPPARTIMRQTPQQPSRQTVRPQPAAQAAQRVRRVESQRSAQRTPDTPRKAAPQRTPSRVTQPPAQRTVTVTPPAAPQARRIEQTPSVQQQPAVRQAPATVTTPASLLPSGAAEAGTDRLGGIRAR